MRDILFRGKTEADKWVYGYLFVLGKGSEYEETYILGDLDHRDSIYDAWKNAEKVIPETVGQFTGRFDQINFRRIFEGDVVKALMDFGPAGLNEVRVVVDFAYSPGGYQWNYFEMSTMEVIGNIHDNPDILRECLDD